MSLGPRRDDPAADVRPTSRYVCPSVPEVLPSEASPPASSMLGSLFFKINCYDITCKIGLSFVTWKWDSAQVTRVRLFPLSGAVGARRGATEGTVG